MSDPRLEILLTAKNLASGEVKTLERDLGSLKGGMTDASKSGTGLAGSLKGLGAFAVVAGAGIAAGVVASMMEFGKKAAESEVVTARLNASLRANVAGWDGNREAIEKTIDASVRLGFTQDTIEASFSTIVTATHNVAKAQETLAAAEDLARLKGISLEDASSALVKVEGGHYRMLQSLGINLKANASATEALAAVQKAAAGQAAAFADTSEGAWQAMNARIDQLQIKIGSALLPAFQHLMDVVDGSAPQIDKITLAIAESGKSMAELDTERAALQKGLEDLRRLGPLFGGFLSGGQIADLTTQLGVVNDQIAHFQSGATAAANVFEARAAGVSAAVTEALAPIPKALTAVAHASYAEAAKIPQGIADGIKAARQKPVDAMAALKDAMKHAISPNKEALQLLGELHGKLLAKGLKSADPEVRAQAQATKLEIEDRLNSLTDDAKQQGFNAGHGLSKAFKDAAKQGFGADFTVSAMLAEKVGSHVGKRAAGGPVAANTPYMVGEHGPELFVPHGSGTVIPNGSSGPARAGGGGGLTVHFNSVWPPTRQQAQDIADLVDRELHWKFQRSAPTVVRT